jgi:hypothetical protein
VIDKFGRCEQSGLWATFVVSTPDFTFINRETRRGPAVGKILYREPKTASPVCARASTEECDYRSTKMIVMMMMMMIVVIIITKQLS